MPGGGEEVPFHLGFAAKLPGARSSSRGAWQHGEDRGRPEGASWAGRGPLGGAKGPKGARKCGGHAQLPRYPQLPQDASPAPPPSRQDPGWAACSPVCLVHRPAGAADPAVAAESLYCSAGFPVILSRSSPRTGPGSRQPGPLQGRSGRASAPLRAPLSAASCSPHTSERRRLSDRASEPPPPREHLTPG